MKHLIAFSFMMMIAISSAHAAEEKMGMYSANCDAAKLKEISKGAITAIEPSGDMDNSYLVTLDTSKMTQMQLSTAMVEAGCF